MKKYLISFALLSSLSLFACSSKAPEADTSAPQATEQAQPAPKAEKHLKLTFDIDYTAATNQALPAKANQLQNDLAKNKNIKADCRPNSKHSQIKCIFENEADIQKLDNLELSITGLKIVSTEQNIVNLGYHDKFLKNIKNISRMHAQSDTKARLKAFGIENADVQIENDKRIIVDAVNVADEQTEDLKTLLTMPAQFAIYLKADEPEEKSVLDELKKQDLNKYNLSIKDDDLFVKDPSTNSAQQALQSLAADMEDLGLIPNSRKLVFENNKTEGPDITYWKAHLIRTDLDVINSDMIDNVSTSTNEETSYPLINIQLNAAGTDAYRKFTNANTHKQIAILLGETVISSATIQKEIADGKMTIPTSDPNRKATARLAALSLNNATSAATLNLSAE